MASAADDEVVGGGVVLSSSDPQSALHIPQSNGRVPPIVHFALDDAPPSLFAASARNN